MTGAGIGNVPGMGDNEALFACFGWISSEVPPRCSPRVCAPADERRRWCDRAGLSLKELEEPAVSFGDASLTGWLVSDDP